MNEATDSIMNTMAADPEDLESGGTPRVTNANDSSYDMEPIPSMDIDNDIDNEPAQTNVIIQTNMTRLGFLWRRHVQSQSDNPHVQAWLERLWLLVLFLSPFVEGPLNYWLGNTNTQQQPQRKPAAAKPKQPLVTRGFVQTQLGGVGYLMAQGGDVKQQQQRATPIVCLHASPRSSDEFWEILPLLAASRRRVVAMDVPGYGVSENPRRSCSLEDDVVHALIEVADALLIHKFVVIASGDLGNALAISLASRVPDRVVACIHANLLSLSSNNPTLPQRLHQWDDEPSTDQGMATPDDDDNNDDSHHPHHLHPDGSHLLELHQRSSQWLDPSLNLRVVQTHLTYLVNEQQRSAKGIHISSSSSSSSHDGSSPWVDHDHDDGLEPVATRRIPNTTTTTTTTNRPVLCIRGEAALLHLDAKGLEGTQRFETACRRLPQAQVKTLSGPTSTIHMINQAPDAFASMCLSFLETNLI